MIKKNVEFNKKGVYLDSIKEGTDIGNLRREGYCEYIEIINCNNIIDKKGNKLIGKDSDKFWKII